MRKIIIAILLFAGIGASAQTWTPVLGRWDYQWLKVDSGYRGPLDTLASAPVGSTAVKGSTLYIKLVTGYWAAITGAGGSGVWGSIAGSLPAQADLAAKFGTKYDTTVRKMDTLYAITDSTYGFYINGIFHSFKARGAIPTFNGRGGPIVLTLSDVTVALGYTPSDLPNVANSLQVINNGNTTSWQTGIYSARPAPGNFGSYYTATDSLAIYFDNGITWLSISKSAVSVPSVFGRTGAVTAQTGDYTPAQVGLANVLNSLQIVNTLGTPSASSDVFANRPAAGTAGRLFVSTDTKEIYRDNGTSWDKVGSGASGGVTTYAALTDVNLTSLINGQIAQYNSGSGKWVNVTPTSSLVGLGSVPNVDATNAANISSGVLPAARIGASSIDLTTKVTGLLPDGNIASAANWNAKKNNNDSLATSPGGYTTQASRRRLEDSVNGNMALRQLNLTYLPITYYTAVADSGTTDNTAPVQACVDSITRSASKKGVIYIPPGVFGLTGTVHIPLGDQITFLGAGGSVGEISNAISKLVTNRTTGDVILDSANNTVFDGFDIQNNAASPTAGAAIHMVGWFAKIRNMAIANFYYNIQLDNSLYDYVSKVSLLEAVQYSLYVNNNPLPDWGDLTVDGCIFQSGTGPIQHATVAAIYQPNSGGIKVINSKFNGSSSGMLTAIRGNFVGAGNSTSDLIVTGNSFEGFSKYAMWITCPGANFANITFSGNEVAGFGSSGNGILLDGTSGGLHRVAISGNTFNSIDTAIQAYHVDQLKISGNSIDSSSTVSYKFVTTFCTNCFFDDWNTGAMVNFGGAPGQLQGTLAGIPAATSYTTGTTYIAQDSGFQYVDTGSGGSRGWKKISGGGGSGGSGGITQLTGDVTAGPGSGSQAATIANNAVTNAKAAQMGANTIKGNNTGSTANAADLTTAQIIAMLNAITNFNGVSFLGYGLYASKPTSGTGIYFASDSILTGGWFYINGSTATNINPSTTIQVLRNGQPGDSSMFSMSGSALAGYIFHVAAQRDSATGCIHHTVNPDGSWTWYSSCVVNNGNVSSLQKGLYSARPAASGNAGACWLATDSAQIACSDGTSWTVFARATTAYSVFTTSANGLVPSPGSATGKVLSDGETWVANGPDTTSLSSRINGKVDTTGQLGIIYQANTWTSGDIGTTFTDSTGGDVIVSGGKLVFGTATGGDYKHTLNFNMPHNLFHWDFWVKFKVTVSSTGSTFGIGVRSINAAGGYHSVVSTTQTNTGAANGTVYLINLDAPGYTATTLNTPVAGQYSATNGGYVLMHVKRDMYTVTTYLRDYTNNTAEYTASFTYADPGTTTFMPNAGTFSIYYLGGTFTVDSISISSTETKNAPLLAVTDSKGGYQSNSFQDSWSYLLGTKVGSVVPFWGGSDESTDGLPCLPMVKLLAPKQVLMIPWSNDLRDGLLTNAQSDSNTAKYYDSLVSWGIRVIVGKPFYETSIDLTPQKTFVESGRLGTNIIDTWTPMTWSGSLYTDGIHPADLGGFRIFNAIVASNMVRRYSNQNEYYGAGFNNSASAGIIPVSLGASSIGPSFITQSGSAGVSAVETVAAQLITSGAGASITFNNRSTNANTFSEYVPASGALAFQDDIGSLIPFSVPENNGSTNPYGMGGFFKARPTGSSFPLGMSADATGRGWLLVPQGSSYGSLANRGLLANISTGYAGFQGFTTISTGVVMQLALNPAGGKVLVNDTTSRTAAALQVRSATGPQLSLIYDNADSANFTVSPSGSLGLTGLTGLTITSSALPTGTTSDSVLVETTSSNVATIKKVAQSSISGGSTPTLQQVFNVGGGGSQALTKSDTITGSNTLYIGSPSSNSLSVNITSNAVNINGPMILGSTLVTGGITSCSDADFTVTYGSGPTFGLILPVVTANRTLTLPVSPPTGWHFTIFNRNTSGTFSWGVAVAIQDASGSSISTLANGTVYQLIYDGSHYIKTN